MSIDIVTVFHNEENQSLAWDLHKQISTFEDTFGFYLHDNSEVNLGFSRACNIAAARGTSPIIGFLNPDCEVRGSFISTVENALVDPVVIVGNRFEKKDVELREWGVKNWVCGATFFVLRDWFEEMGGFDERFVWSHEETDFIRRTEQAGKRVLDLSLPIHHKSPLSDSPKDREYKTRMFEEAKALYVEKWRNNV